MEIAFLAYTAEALRIKISTNKNDTRPKWENLEFWKDKGNVDASSQTDSRELEGVYMFEVGTQYLVGDACRDWRTHSELQDGYFKVFYAMTIQNARGYLAAHRFRSSERTKLGVTEDCVDLRMREVRGGQITERFQGIFEGIKASDRK